MRIKFLLLKHDLSCEVISWIYHRKNFGLPVNKVTGPDSEQIIPHDVVHCKDTCIHGHTLSFI